MYLREKYRRPEDAHPRAAKATSGLRFLNPGLGRWCSRDPIGEESGGSLYSAIGNTPIDAYDSLGEAVEYRTHRSAGCNGGPTRVTVVTPSSPGHIPGGYGLARIFCFGHPLHSADTALCDTETHVSVEARCEAPGLIV